MPSNKRQKELARRRAERQAARKAAERARRRKRRTLMGLTIGGVAAAVVLLLVLVSALRGGDDGDPTATDETPTPGPVACGASAPPPVKKQTFKEEPKLTIDKAKTYTATLKTSCGDIVFSLDAKNAPHTTNSFAFLTGKKYYDGTFCHRMTNSPGLTVLQCGDPDGTGAGGPGYTLAEENLKGAKYTRGTVAMAKTAQPHSTGSQFFLVAKDSELPPDYTIVGTMTDASLAVLDKILALGIEGGATDGAPASKVYIETFTVAAK